MQVYIFVHTYQHWQWGDLHFSFYEIQGPGSSDELVEISSPFIGWHRIASDPGLSNQIQLGKSRTNLADLNGLEEKFQFQPSTDPAYNMMTIINVGEIVVVENYRYHNSDGDNF